VIIALDREERGTGELSAAQEVKRDYGIPCISIAGLNDLIHYLKDRDERRVDIAAIQEYRNRYGSSQ
jgi:orotate phosphoribosyltransferase